MKPKDIGDLITVLEPADAPLVTIFRKLRKLRKLKGRQPIQQAEITWIEDELVPWFASIVEETEKKVLRLCPFFIACGRTSCTFYTPKETHSKKIYCPYGIELDMAVKDRNAGRAITPEFEDLVKKEEGVFDLIDVQQEN